VAKQIGPKLLRLIFQARYKPELVFFSLADAAAARFQDDYPIWQRDVDGDLRLSDYSHRCMLALSHQAFSYSQDSSDLGLAATRISRALDELPGSLQLKEYKRIGLRHFMLVPVSMDFESLVAVMATKLFVQAPPLQEALPEKLDDMLYRIDGSEGEHRFHVTIAPVHREEISGKIIKLTQTGTIDPAKLGDAVKESEESYPPVAVFLDIDMYLESDKIDLGAGKAFVQSAGQRIERLVVGTAEYLLRVRL